MLLQARPNFVSQYRHSRDFYLVANIEGYEPPRHERALAAGLVFVCYVLWLVVGSIPGMESFLPGLGEPAIGALGAALAMVGLRCISVGAGSQCPRICRLSDHNWQRDRWARRWIRPVQHRGIAEALVNLCGGTAVSGPRGCISLLQVFLPSLSTNNAVAVSLFPVGSSCGCPNGDRPPPADHRNHSGAHP